MVVCPDHQHVIGPRAVRACGLAQPTRSAGHYAWARPQACPASAVAFKPKTSVARASFQLVIIIIWPRHIYSYSFSQVPCSFYGSVNHSIPTNANCGKQPTQSRCSLGWWIGSGPSEEPCIRWRSKFPPPTKRGKFWEGNGVAQCNCMRRKQHRGNTTWSQITLNKLVSFLKTMLIQSSATIKQLASTTTERCTTTNNIFASWIITECPVIDSIPRASMSHTQYHNVKC